MTKKEAALKYAGMGLRVHPLRANSKLPRLTGWPVEASNDPEKVAAWWDKWPNANIGIAAGSGLAVIDCDRKNGKDGIKALAPYNVPETWTAATPSGGRHYYLSTGKDCKNYVNVIPGVDIRSDGGYVVAPPSVINGKAYEWLTGTEEPLAAGDRLIGALTADIDGLIPEGQRNDHLFRYGSKLQGDGVPDNVILEAMKERNLEKCVPPLPDEEVERTYKSIIGRYKKGELFPDDNEVEATSAAALMKKSIPPIDWIVKDVLPPGLSILGAPPKYFKSFMALDLCLSVSQGRDFLGFKTVKSSCLLFDLESTLRRPKDRLQKMLGFDEAPQNFYIICGDQEVGVIGEGFEETLEKQLEKHPDIRLVVIDVFQYVRAPAKNNQSGYDRDYADFKALKRIADLHNIAILVLHHTRKMRDKDVYNMLSGSVGTLGAMDAAFVIEKERRDDKNAYFYITGRDIDSKNLVITFNKQMFRWQIVGEASALEWIKYQNDYDENDITKTIRALMKRYDGHWSGTIEELRAASDWLWKEGANSIMVDNSVIGRFINEHKKDFLSFDGIKVERKRNKSNRYIDLSLVFTSSSPSPPSPLSPLSPLSF